MKGIINIIYSVGFETYSMLLHGRHGVTQKDSAVDMDRHGNLKKRKEV